MRPITQPSLCARLIPHNEETEGTCQVEAQQPPALVRPTSLDAKDEMTGLCMVAMVKADIQLGHRQLWPNTFSCRSVVEEFGLSIEELLTVSR